MLRTPVRAVLFDLDGTLYWQVPVRVAMACEMALSCATAWNRGVADVRMVFAFRRIREELRFDGASREPLERRQYDAVATQLSCSAAAVRRAVDQWIYRRPLKWLRYCRRSGLLEFLDFLAARGVRCGVLSDYPSHEKLAALGIANRFDLVLSAVDADIDAFKPDPRGFVVASARWGIPTREVLYVGDRTDVDAVGAAAAGMQCVLITERPEHGPDFVAVHGFRALRQALERVVPEHNLQSGRL
jgi:HAD superfamily hydrolase (TIGR01549 family)